MAVSTLFSFSPTADTKISWPESTPRVKTASTLLAFTIALFVVTFFTFISQGKVLQVFTNMDAGRACKPAGCDIKNLASDKVDLLLFVGFLHYFY
jgi:hypothetical protein